MQEYGEPVGEVSVDRAGTPYAWTFRSRRYTGGGLIDRWGSAQGTEHWLMAASSHVGEGLVELARTGEGWQLVGMGRPRGQTGRNPVLCPYGHELKPGHVLCGWSPCVCPSAVRCYGGHATTQCLACIDEGARTICYRPPHLPGDGGRARHPLEIPRGTQPGDRSAGAGSDEFLRPDRST